MKQLTRNGLVVAVAAGGLLILSGGAAVAGAGSGSASSNDGSVLSGNNTNAAVNAPVTACGNAAAVAGDSRAECAPHEGSHGSAAGSSSRNTDSVGSGNNTNAAVNAPLTACGNAAAVAGDSRAGCDPRSSGGAEAGSSSGNDGSVLSGNNTNAAVNAPVTACGNTVAVAGDAKAGCRAGNGDDMSSPGGDEPAQRDQLNGAGADTQQGAGGLAALAHTGGPLLGALSLAGGLVAGGLLLYRRFRSGAA